MLLNCGAGEDLESPLNCMEIKPVNSKGNQSLIFIGRIDARELVMNREGWSAAIQGVAKSQTQRSN